MTDAYEFEDSCLEMPMWTACEAAYRLAGLDPDGHESSDPHPRHGWQEDSFVLMPGCWRDRATRNADNILAALKFFQAETDRAERIGTVKTLSPREWIEWALSRNLRPEWLDRAYQDASKHAYLPPRDAESATPAGSDGGSFQALRGAFGRVPAMYRRLWGNANPTDKDTWMKKPQRMEILEREFDLKKSSAKIFDTHLTPDWAETRGRPSDAEKG
ncbi:hypothetical protein F6X40_12220 [Paraburkholderia sp. UCT31]|uniref:hypothetical protein n=1 Tax=Paraburkholderia sp. UCT31 TaxID=2615209 RepID=UPI0016550F8E|nr:hypothetical protein [Paraburkholderia sp. UCT31]MBC8737566.1 hypothetical protein [Paraburkholderia sp. UCT31]